MNARELKKGQKFNVIGWPKAGVLEVIIPFIQPDSDCAKVIICQKNGKNVEMCGFGVLAGDGERIGEGFVNTYAIPVTAEVELVE